MASGIFKSGVTPISEGGTGKTSWEDALNAFNGIPGVTLSGPDVDLNTVLYNVFKVRCNASINTSLATAIGNGFAYIIQLFYSDDFTARDKDSTRIQIAFPYQLTSNKMAWRCCTKSGGVGSWGAWHVVTAS